MTEAQTPKSRTPDDERNAPYDIQQVIAGVLTTHRIECTGVSEVTCRGCRDRGWMRWAAFIAHLAAEVVTALGLREEWGRQIVNDSCGNGHLEGQISTLYRTEADALEEMFSDQRAVRRYVTPFPEVPADE